MEINPLALALIATVLAVVLVSAGWGYFLFDRAKGPIIWTFGDGPHPIFGMNGGGPSARPLISQLQISGVNRSDEPISNVDGYLRVDRTNQTFPIFFQVRGQMILTRNTNGIPPRTAFTVYAPFTLDQSKFGEFFIPAGQFLSEFSDLTFFLTFEGQNKPFVHHFSRDQMEKNIDEFEKSLRPPSQPEIIAK